MVGCHPAGHTKSVIGEVIQKPAMLQLWSVPGASGSSSSDRQHPLMKMGICHQGGLSWDCKWCPYDASMQVPASPVNQSSSENLPRHVPTAGGMAKLLSIYESAFPLSRAALTIMHQHIVIPSVQPLFCHVFAASFGVYMSADWGFWQQCWAMAT